MPFVSGKPSRSGGGRPRNSAGLFVHTEARSEDGDSCSISNGNDIDVNATDSEGCTELMKASGNGHIEIVKTILDHNANVDIQNDLGETALTFASFNGHIDCVRLLLENGANATLKNKDGKTANDLAQQKGLLEIVNLLTEVNLADLNTSVFSTLFTHGRT